MTTAPRKKTILFVDDEPNVLSSVRRLLRREGWNLLTAGSGREGLEVLAANPVDLVVSDMRMPEMDGAAFLRQVKECYPAVIRIVLTGYSERQAVTRAFAEADLHEMISKPWDDDELREILRDALQQSASQEGAAHGLHQLINDIDTLPALPQVYAQVRAALKEAAEPSAESVARIILREPTMAARILRIANSAFFGQRRRIETLSRAIVVLGFDMVANLVLSTAVFQDLMDGGVPGFDHSALWRHSVGCGLATRAIEEKRGGDIRRLEEAALAGLLHDLGKLIFARFMPDRFSNALVTAARQQAPLVEVEEGILGATHAAVGGYLADWWNLPAPIADALRWHHDPARSEHDVHLVIAVHLADVLAHRTGFGSSGNGRAPDIGLPADRQVGIGSEELKQIERKLVLQAEDEAFLA